MFRDIILDGKWSENDVKRTDNLETWNRCSKTGKRTGKGGVFVPFYRFTVFFHTSVRYDVLLPFKSKRYRDAKSYSKVQIIRFIHDIQTSQ